MQLNLHRFLRTIKNVFVSALCVRRIKDYLQHCFEKLKNRKNNLYRNCRNTYQQKNHRIEPGKRSQSLSLI